MTARPFFAGLALVLLAACGAASEDDAASSADELSQNIAHRFDVVSFQCGEGRNACAADADKCLCPSEFAGLDYDGHRHYVAMPTDAHRAEIGAKTNALAAYEDDFNASYRDGKSGVEGADALVAKLEGNFARLPTYVILNEISKGAWKSSMAYRQYVVDFVRRLHEAHGLVPVVASPYALPKQFTDGKSWSAVAKWAFIADEVQLTGREVKDSGFSVDAARRTYQASIDSYAAVGVPKSRLMILDNFSNTKADETFGRAGVSREDWIRAIRVRAQAAGSLNAVGYVSYAWSGNWMHDTSANRLAYMHAYASEAVP